MYIICCYCSVHYSGQNASTALKMFQWKYTVVEEVFRSFTSVKVLIPHCKNTQLQVKVLH